MSERKVNQDQRLTENTLSENKQSDLETEYTHSFKDGERADFIDFIQRKSQRAGHPSATESLVGASRLACLIFEVQISILLPRVLSKLEYIKIIQDRRCFQFFKVINDVIMTSFMTLKN